MKMTRSAFLVGGAAAWLLGIFWLSPRPAPVDPAKARTDARHLWPYFLRRVYGDIPGSRVRAAEDFRVTVQTSCNWFDGKVEPIGGALLYAARKWPRPFHIVMVQGIVSDG